MIFNNRQIDDMVDILRRWQYLFIAKHVGVDFLTQSEIDILVASGVNVDKYKNTKGIMNTLFCSVSWLRHSAINAPRR